MKSGRSRSTAGWLKVNRSLLVHPLWTSGRFSRGQAWLELNLCANFQDQECFTPHGPARVKRGQFLTTQTALAQRWGWDRETVRSFLDTLESHSMVRIETSKATSTGYTLITILDYERSERDGAADPASTSTSDPASTRHPRPIHASRSKKVKNDKKKKKGEVPLAPTTPDLDQDVERIVERHRELFKAKRGAKLSVGAEDREKLKQVVAELGVDDVLARLDAFFASNNQWIRESDYSVAAFVAARHRSIPAKVDGANGPGVPPSQRPAAVPTSRATSAGEWTVPAASARPYPLEAGRYWHAAGPCRTKHSSCGAAIESGKSRP